LCRSGSGCCFRLEARKSSPDKDRIRAEFQERLQTAERLPVALGMAAVSIFFMGQFTLVTYLRPFLEAVTHVGVSTLSLLLLLIGVAGFLGTILIGPFLKENLCRTLIIIPVLMAMIAVALISFGGSVVVTAMLLGIWGLVATAAPVAGGRG
jgi:predicted MFS family arabinose efflux permease